MYWDSIVERKIDVAIAEGVFDDMPGNGRPLKLDDNQFVEKDWQLVIDMLKAASFIPIRIELDREIRERLFQARKTLRKKLNLSTAGSMSYQSALDRFQQAVDKINVLIRELKLLVPSSRFCRLLINADSELKGAQADLITPGEKKTDHLAGS